MTQYVVRRVLLLVPILLAAYTLTFILFQLTPGGPWSREKPLPKQAIEYLNAKYGLDKPIYLQYFTYLGNVVTHLDLGPSYKQTSRTVTEIIGQYFPFSLILGVFVRLWGVIGALQILNLWLGLYSAPGEWPWTYFFLLVLMFIFAVHRFGRSLGIDALIAARRARTRPSRARSVIDLLT